MGIQVMGKMGIGMQCWNGNGLEWELLDGSGKGMGTRKSFPHTSSSRPSDHYFRSVCLFVCAEFFSAVFDPISIKLGYMLYVWV